MGGEQWGGSQRQKVKERREVERKINRVSKGKGRLGVGGPQVAGRNRTW